MPPPYDGYQQAGYAHGAGQYSAYGQAQMSHEAFNPIQQQRPMAAPSVSSSQLQPQPQWQNSTHPQANYNYNYQPQQQFVPPPQHRSYPVPHQQTQQYQHSSPLQQFAAGHLQDSRQQQYWQSQAQESDYLSPYQQAPSQVQPSQINGHSYLPGRNDFGQSIGSSPILTHHAGVDQTNYGLVNRQRPQPQQHVPQPSQFQHPLPAPNSQRQQSVSSRPSQTTLSSDPRHLQQQQYQHTNTQPTHPFQRQTHPSQPANGSVQHTPSRQPIQTPQRTVQPVQAPSSTPNSRTLTHVQIPAYRPVEMPPQPTPQDRTAKRRRSNEGASITVSQPQKQQQKPVQKAYVQIPKPPESSPLTDIVSSQVVPPTPSPNVDYQAALLALSDEYVTAAHTMSARLCSPEATEDDLLQYHKLIATALGCLESLIANYRIQDARKEARARLRFANLLFEETENTIATEEALSKGISFCERNRLADTKYAMHHLLVRVMFKTNSTAAIKTLEKLIQEVESIGLNQWIYALRFLRVSLSLESGMSSDTSVILRHIAALNDHADTYQHTGVQVAAATLDAIVHLRSGDSMAAELASRSLASARTHQLGPVMAEIPQLRATLDSLDLACAFMQCSPIDQTDQKVDQFHQSLDAKAKNNGWGKDGTFSLPLGFTASNDIEADTGGIFRKTSAGEVALALMWFSRSQLYMIGYMLGAISKMPKNGEDRKSEACLAEGLKSNVPDVDAPAMSIKATEAMNDTRQRAAVTLKLLQIFAYCGRAEWKSALQATETLGTELAQSPQYQDQYTACAILYLSGVCKHGLGEEDAALCFYRMPELSMQSSPHKTTTPVKDLQALSALNSVLIMRSLPQDPRIAEKLLADLGPYCESNPNKAIVSAYYLLCAHNPDPGMTIIKVKHYIQAALRPAQTVKNVRIMAIIMNTMTAQFFGGIVGKQAMNSASAALQLGRRSQDPLWASVGAGMSRDAKKRSGDIAGAVEADRMARGMMSKLPVGVRSRLM